MRRAATLWESTVGKKIVMAATGLILLFFVLGHAFGNLKAYQGPEHFNAYATGLRSFGAPLLAHGQVLWLVRIVLIVSVVLHIWAGVALTLRSWSMRDTGYKKFDYLGFAWSSRTMFWGGLIVFAFVTLHLMDLTWGVRAVHPGFVEGDAGHSFAYENFVGTFRRPGMSVAYIVAMIPLGLHLYHGFWSMLQTLGWNNVRYNAYRRPLAALIALAIFLVNISFPLAVLTGIIHE